MKYYWYYFRSNNSNDVLMYPCKTLEEAEELDAVAASDDGGKACGFFGYYIKPVSEETARESLVETYDQGENIVVTHTKPERSF